MGGVGLFCLKVVVGLAVVKKHDRSLQCCCLERETFPNATLTSKIWKNWSVDQKDQRRHSVWVGQADFSKIAQRKQKFIKHVNCVFT